MESHTDTAVLEKLLDPLTRSFTPEMARGLVDFRVDEQTQNLIDELGEKANEGTLSQSEQRQYESYVRAGNLIAILQAKARKILAGNRAD